MSEFKKVHPPASGVVSTQKRYVSTVVKAQSTESIIDDAKSIIRDQITRYKIQSSQGLELDDSEAKKLRIYIQSLMEMSREEREIEKSDKLADMLQGLSNEELLEMYKKQLDVKK